MQFILTTEEELRAIIASELARLQNTQFVGERKESTFPRKDSYTSKEIQALFNISTTTIWNYERKGILRPVIMGRKKTYMGEDILSLIESKKLQKRG